MVAAAHIGQKRADLRMARLIGTGLTVSDCDGTVIAICTNVMRL
jgi:hypothetical protein